MPDIELNIQLKMKSRVHCVRDKNTESQRILTKLRTLYSEYIFEYNHKISLENIL